MGLVELGASLDPGITICSSCWRLLLAGPGGPPGPGGPDDWGPSYIVLFGLGDEEPGPALEAGVRGRGELLGCWLGEGL